MAPEIIKGGESMLTLRYPVRIDPSYTHTRTQTHESWCGVFTDVAYQISWCGVLKFGTPHQKGVKFPDVAYGKIVFPDMA